MMIVKNVVDQLVNHWYDCLC